MSSVIEHIAFDQFVLDCRRLANIIHKAGAPKRIVAVTRGGLVPASVISQFLDIREIHTIGLSSYDDMQKSEDIVEYVCPDVEDSPDTLFVDDLVDSGHTHQYIKEKYPHSKIAVIYSKNPPCSLKAHDIIRHCRQWCQRNYHLIAIPFHIVICLPPV